jgi:hypothetical protein
MARPPSPKNADSPLRLLRGLLSEQGKDHPITLSEFNKVTGIPANTVKAIENSQRALTDTILFQVLLGTGATWDKTKKQWVCAERASTAGIPFTRAFYLEFKDHVARRPLGAEFGVQVLAVKLALLFERISDRQWFRLLFWVDKFLEECRKDFHIEGLERDFKAMRAGLLVSSDASSGKILQVNRHYPPDLLEVARELEGKYSSTAGAAPQGSPAPSKEKPAVTHLRTTIAVGDDTSQPTVEAQTNDAPPKPKRTAKR